MAGLGAFTKQPGGASDAAKALWSMHLGFAQGRLDVMQAGIGGERLHTAPPLPKLGSPAWRRARCTRQGAQNALPASVLCPAFAGHQWYRKLVQNWSGFVNHRFENKSVTA